MPTEKQTQKKTPDPERATSLAREKLTRPRGLTAQIPDLTPAQAEEAMVSAVQALGVVEGLAAKPLLEELADKDPSLKVRRAALAALDSLGD